jgi:hypothetical protein
VRPRSSQGYAPEAHFGRFGASFLASHRHLDTLAASLFLSSVSHTLFTYHLGRYQHTGALRQGEHNGARRRRALSAIRVTSDDTLWLRLALLERLAISKRRAASGLRTPCSLPTSRVAERERAAHYVSATTVAHFVSRFSPRSQRSHRGTHR